MHSLYSLRQTETARPHVSYKCCISTVSSLLRAQSHSAGQAGRHAWSRARWCHTRSAFNGSLLRSTQRHTSQGCRAAEDEIPNAAKDDSVASKILDRAPSLGEGPGSAVLLLSWAAFVGYALFLSPNLTPQRDMYFIEKLVGLQRDSFQVSTLFTCLFNAMGIYPLIFLALLQPSGKSDNKIPTWPFTTLSFGLGFLSLGLYFALWKPSAEVQSPPSKQQLEGFRNLSLKGTESTILSFLILLIVVGLVGTAGVAALQPEQWETYFHLFDESRLVHVSTLDFALLTAAAPFWMSNDAQQRKWEGRSQWLPVLSFLPLLGPAIYLALRPKAN